MKDQIYRIDYFAVTADDRPGEGARIGRRFEQEGVNLLAVSAFPSGPGKVQVDFVPENAEQFTKAARKIGLAAGAPKTAFLVQGTDRPGALGEVLGRLGNSGINVRATLGVAAGGKRYGGLLWVAAEDVERAARALGATSLPAHV